MVPIERPLSPHLQVYRPQITSVLSILHRLTGIALTVGLLAFLFWLGAIALGPDAYAFSKHFFSSYFGRFLLIGWTFSFYYHLANGIRHLFWDAGYGYELTTTRRSGWAVVLFSIAITLLTWVIAL
jgi:succinate dehydrogenase / fumarate reductase cytochrome b subunit